jgi:hypothetical protein
MNESEISKVYEEGKREILQTVEEERANIADIEEDCARKIAHIKARIEECRVSFMNSINGVENERKNRIAPHKERINDLNAHLSILRDKYVNEFEKEREGQR